MIRIRKKYVLVSSLMAAFCVLSGIDLGALFHPRITSESSMIGCYDATSTNKMPSIDATFVPKNTSIFFVETRCFSGYFNLTPRQACAVESAALLNPNSAVFVLVPSPIAEGNKFDAHVQELLTYPNVWIRHIDMDSFFLETPLNAWYKKGKLKSSYWPQFHASDLIRYTLLWKYGGTYADLDFVFMKPLDGLTNFAAAESIRVVAAGCISMSFRHPVTDLCISDILSHFKGYDWAANGPGVITRTLRRYCRVHYVSRMSTQACKGFKVFPPSTFYPIPWGSWQSYFSESESEKVMRKIENSYAAHVWNYLSRDMGVEVGSKQPYALLASKYCPRVYSTIEAVF